jgi:hypothetical protein
MGKIKDIKNLMKKSNQVSSPLPVAIMESNTRD